MAIREHADRAAVLAELHLRPFLAYPTPCDFHHFAFVLGSGREASELEYLGRVCRALHLRAPAADARFHYTGDANQPERSTFLRFEMHGEFATYLLGLPLGTPEAPAARDVLRRFHAVEHPGALLVQCRLLLRTSTLSAPVPEDMFDRQSLAVVLASEGQARVTTDFMADASGDVRIYVENFGMSPTRAGRLVQRLLELETYRCFALLGLPASRRADPEVRKAESQLLELTQSMTGAADTTRNRALLDRLTRLAADMEASIAANTFRFGATQAYAALVNRRLGVIREEEHQGYISFSRFLERRFRPAIDTCSALENRQRATASRLANAVAVLRTRIQSDLEEQNRELLRALNRRSRLQLRLQQTVEGLSVAAISYYVVGLIGYGAKALKDAGLLYQRLTPEIVAGLAVPLVLVTVWAGLRRARRHLTAKSGE